MTLYLIPLNLHMLSNLFCEIEQYNQSYSEKLPCDITHTYITIMILFFFKGFFKDQRMYYCKQINNQANNCYLKSCVDPENKIKSVQFEKEEIK